MYKSFTYYFLLNVSSTFKIVETRDLVIKKQISLILPKFFTMFSALTTT